MHLSAAFGTRVRGAFFVSVMAASFGLAALPARAATPAETFVSVNIQKGLTILGNRNLAPADKSARFRDFLTELTDIRRIALFTLGPVKRTASPADLNAFVDAFHDFAVGVYESRLSAYSGQTLKVTGSNERAPGDYIVSTVIVDPNAQSGDQPLQVDFRVEDENGRFVVIDVSVAGIWLAIEERDQFTAFLDQNQESVPALVSHLKQLTRQIRNGGPPPSE
ncbi:MAG TPA: ABC transporter substrate-binding protein [Rhizomicrobium sp.]